MTIDQAMQLAVQHHRAGKLNDAEAIYRQILQTVPNHPHALHNLGEIAYRVRRFDVASDFIRKSIALEPNNASFHNTLSAIAFAVGDIELADREARHAVKIDPNLSFAHGNLGNALIGSGDYHGALASFEKAIELDSKNAIAHDGLGATLLMMGDLQRGWKEREWRWQKPDFETHRFPGKPYWDGSDLTGKAILLMVEQGYGDVFQFARYAPLLQERGARVLLEVVPDIHALMSTLAGVNQLVIAGLQQPAFDLVCPLLSVPLWYGTTMETIPAKVPYLSADPRLVEAWQRKYFRNDPNLKIGIAWAGRPTHANNHNRSMTLAALAPLADIPGVTFYSIQKGDASKQLATPPPGMKIIDLSTALTDFNQTAAVIAGLDLVIAVDTGVVHLAGALGKPVWVLVPFVPDWRWLLDREDTPWYPTMRLFRQKNIGDWAGVMQRVADSLRARVQK
jgi:Flp pilus assembly protein TadD